MLFSVKMWPKTVKFQKLLPDQRVSYEMFKSYHKASAHSLTLFYRNNQTI